VRVRYTPRALRHIRTIGGYLRARNPTAAQRAARTIRNTVQLLTCFPELGHEGVRPGTREYVIPRLPYIFVYRFDAGSTLTILGIYHGAQLRPGLEPPSDDEDS
jgi:toxin ParE1/3/4